jgi:Uncharacterised P-loop hydrolase UPF0079.
MTPDQLIETVKRGDVIVLQGIPGSGKTTLADKISNSLPLMSTVIPYSADFYMVNPKTNKYEFDRSKLGECHNKCLGAFLRCLYRDSAKTATLIVDNTNTTNLEIAPYMAAAAAFGRNAYVVTVTLLRWQTAVFRQIHDVPNGHIEDMANRLSHSTINMPKYWPHKVVTND